MSNLILEGKKLTKIYEDGGRKILACDEIDIELEKGESLGVVGESGCGKSSLLRLLAQLEKPDSGELYLKNRKVSQLKGEALRKNRRLLQMVFQDPNSSFFSRIKVGDALSQPLKNFYKLSKAEIEKKVDRTLETVRLDQEFKERYPHSMSGGQRQRVGIARTLILEPEILLCDEATSALDVSVQDEIIKLLVAIQKERDLSIIFVCHDLALVQSFCHRVMVMYLGNIVEILAGESVRDSARHPYTKALVESVFTMDMQKTKQLKILKGDPPSPVNLPQGCPFSSRCKYAEKICFSEKPSLRAIGEKQKVACHLV